jgi:glycosyltransferase involved in cell wall biosynthesis
MTFATPSRLLLSAYQCDPGMGSASKIGWEWYSRLAPRVPTTLVTHIRNQEALAKAGAPLASSEVIFVDTTRFAKPLYRLGTKLLPRSQRAGSWISSLDFFVYDRCAVTLLHQRITAGERWDIVHAVTPVSPTAPTWLYRLGAPLVLGPLNGGLGTPGAFPQAMREESAPHTPVPNVGRLFDLFVGSTRNAAAILTANRRTRTHIPRRYRLRCIPMLENGVDLNLFSPAPWPVGPSKVQALKILFVGRLVPPKGVPLLLEALTRVRDEFPVRLTVVGEGLSRVPWEEETRARGLHDIVSFTGPLSPREVSAEMRAAHVFCSPSMRESGSAVLLEAMAAARPVIAMAYGGPAEVVDDGVGRAILPGSPEAVIEALTQTLRDVVSDPEAWRRRGEEGRRRAEQRYAWDVRIDAILRLYGQLLEVRQGVGVSRSH